VRVSKRHWLVFGVSARAAREASELSDHTKDKEKYVAAMREEDYAKNSKPQERMSANYR
jgi:hypothetical protein